MRERVLVGLLAMALVGGCKTGVEKTRADMAAENAPVPTKSRDQLATMRETLTQELRHNSPLKDVVWDAAIVGHPIKGIWLVGDALYVETRDHYVYALDA
ncbi:MAG: hypothetical protein HZA54_18765, partial [Planctomycetes bacterium]|nr:hypothetical protein [Planctomycetota bacterium]